MEHFTRELAQRVEGWRERGWPLPSVVIVAGSGLSVELGQTVVGPEPLAQLLPFETEAIEGHPLQWRLVEIGERTALYYQGRLHAYQGFTAAQVVFPVRLAALLGAGTLVISNAAGCLREGVPAGRLFLLRDQLNLTSRSPLVGSPPTEWGPRFPDLSEVFSARLRGLAREVAQDRGVVLAEGVYAGLLGPAYETPAEVEMLRRLGADLVGMSTVLETIAARHMGLEVLGLSLASNPAAGLATEPLDHEEVLAAGRMASEDFGRLVSGVLERLDAQS